MSSARHLALVGPTASGKSELALLAAERLGDVEIVSVDSMQVYRGMDVGTAKPSPEARARVAHHLVDVADPSEEWSVVRFRDAVRAAVSGIEARGRRALLAGGTGLYLRAVVDPLEFPPEDRRLRAAVAAEAAEPGGLERLLGELARRDPLAASRVDPANERRIVRALEVIRLTGRPFSSFGPGLTEYGDTVLDVALVGVRLPRPVLDRRIAERLERMRASGLVEEVRGLVRSGRPSRTAAQAIGYREVAEHLEGRRTLDEALEEAERRTRALARRQLRWFERDPRIRWIDVDGDAAEALEPLVEAWSPCPVST